MWVISGPFDGVQEGVKEKLLKPGTTYTVGRAKAGQSLLNRINLEQKAISHEHVDIIVGSYEIDDVSDSQAKPAVQLVVKREKDIMVSNQRVSKGMVFDLEPGSEIALTNKISIYLLWRPVVVVNADNRVKKDKMREIAAAAAKLGVTVSKTWKDNATHFVTPSVNMSRRALHSLMLGIPLVDMKWLEELFRRGNTLTVDSESDGNGVVALESHFVLPTEQDFRPKLVKPDDEDEDITEWPIELWDANPARKNIWNGLQFHFFCDDTAPTEWTDQIQLGGGTFLSHNFNPEHGEEPVTTAEEAKNLFQNIRIGAGKLNKVPGMMSPIVVVVKPSELTAVLGKPTWKLYQEGMKLNGFKYITPKDLTLAALRMDITSIDCGLETFESSAPTAQLPRKSTTSTLSSLPSVVPPSRTGDMSASGLPSVINTSVSVVPGPSEAPEPDSMSGVRRARPLKKLRPQSREPSVIQSPIPGAQEALPEVIEEKQDTVSEVPRPRLLKRRVKTTTIAEALGLDDSSASITPLILSDEDTKPKPVAKKLERTKPPSSTIIQESTQTTTFPNTSRPNRLKRRADVLSERTTAVPPPIEVDIPEAPALKRYRQLFEGVERAASSVIGIDGSSTISAVAPAQPLQPPVASDESRKRKSADRDEDDDVNMEDATRTKRRVPTSGISQKPNHLGEARPDVEANMESPATQFQLPPPGQTHTRTPGTRGAVPGAPDKDNALLDALGQAEKEQAVVPKGSKTKGAKTAPIDKEFSNMRIAEEKEKEEASRRRAEEMRIWEECERDINVRGNFMVVELVDLVRRNRGPPARSINPAWEGKPDFKKFKKKATDYWEQKAALADVRGSSEGPRNNARVQDDDSDTPVPHTARVRGRKIPQVATSPKASVIAEPKSKPKQKVQRIAISSDESDEEELGKLKGASSGVGIGKRRPIATSARKTNLADFGMRDDDSDSGRGERPRRGARQEEQSYGSSARAGDEDAVSHMVEQESHQVATTGALSHMSSLGGASLGVRKPAASSSSVSKPSKPKKVVVADSDSDGGGFKGFGTKRRKRGAL